LLARPLSDKGDWEYLNAFYHFPQFGETSTSKTGNLSGRATSHGHWPRTHGATLNCLILDEVKLGLSPLVVDQCMPFDRKFTRPGTTNFVVEKTYERAITSLSGNLQCLKVVSCSISYTADTSR